MIKTTDQIIQQIAEVLSQSDGKFIEAVANEILTNNVTYLGDSLFDDGEKDETDIDEEPF